MSGKAWNTLELISWTATYFKENGIAQARLDAEVLLAHVLGVQRLDLYLRFEETVAQAERARFRELVRERAAERVPVAYLTGEREFWSLPIRVTRDVLIPRPDTELLVRCAVDLAPARVAEIGVGSGAVLAALAKELEGTRFTGVECSEAALDVARGNLEQLGFADRVTLLCGDGLAPLEPGFDLIVSNPPYIPTEELAGLEPELAHEPRLALDGGPDGLDFIRCLVQSIPEHLSDGWFLLEVGADQAAAVQTLLGEAGAKEIRSECDLAGIERVVAARFQAEGAG